MEWRTYANISSSEYEFALYSADDGGGSQLWTSGSIIAPTSAATKKYSPMVTGVESIRLATRHASSPAAFIFDYLRGSLSTESGWQHDGSTTAGVSDEGDTDYENVVICPYCGEKHEPDCESKAFYNDGDHDFDCYNCENSFKLETHFEISYSTTK